MAEDAFFIHVRPKALLIETWFWLVWLNISEYNQCILYPSFFWFLVFLTLSVQVSLKTRYLNNQTYCSHGSQKKEKILLETPDTGLPTKRDKCFLIFISPCNCKLASFFVYSPNSAIDGNVEFVHTLTQYSCILTSQVSTKFDVSEKIINNSDNFRIKCLSDSKISAILCVLYILFLHFFI